MNTWNSRPMKRASDPLAKLSTIERNWPFRNMRIVSNPRIALWAVFCDWKPRTGRIRCFSLPWSDSSRLFRFLDLSVSAGCRKPSLAPQRGDRFVGGRVLVGREHRRPVMWGTAQRFAEKAFGGLGRALGRQVEVERLAPVA